MADARIACRICRAKGETPMNCRTDKSMYAPNETVCVYVDGLPAETVSLRLILSHLEKTVLTEEIAAAERFSLLPQRRTARDTCLRCRRWTRTKRFWQTPLQPLTFPPPGPGFHATATCGILPRAWTRKQKSRRYAAFTSTACSFTTGSISDGNDGASIARDVFLLHLLHGKPLRAKIIRCGLGQASGNSVKCWVGAICSLVP